MNDLDPSFVCEVCSFKVWLPLARLSVSTLGLYDDGRFPGRSIVVFNRHVEDLVALDEDEARSLIADVQRASRAIMSSTGAPRVNYAILGNVEPHLHVHIIPRGTASDPLPKRTPWEHPRPVQRLSHEEAESLRKSIVASLHALNEEGNSRIVRH